MPDLLVRNVRPETLAFLKRRAANNGRSLQAEVLDVLEHEEAAERELWIRVKDFKDSLRGRPHSDSAELIREDRDSR